MGEEALQLHREALSLVVHADAAEARGDVATARALTEAAYVLERRAAELAEREPGRSFICRQAAWLALSLGRTEEALELAGAGLGGEPPAEIAEGLRVVRALASRATATGSAA